MDMKKIALGLMILVMTAAGGCIPTRWDTPPGNLTSHYEQQTGMRYLLYVPSTYKLEGDKQLPLVVLLHGTYGFDPPEWQMQEWQGLAEREGFLVIAPSLNSVQGIIPVNKWFRGLWLKDLEKDNVGVIAVMDEVAEHYRVDASAVLLTGFSSGGYPLYYVGIKNRPRFNMLVAVSCNFDGGSLDGLPLDEATLSLPVGVIHPRDDVKMIHDMCWEQFRWLREHGFEKAERIPDQGGHFRRPEMVYDIWQDYIPEKYRTKPKEK